MTKLDSPLPPDVAALVGAELRPGERVTWAGQPLPGRFARRRLGVVLLAVPWTAFAVFWVAAASGFKRPDFSRGKGLFPLFGVPFVLVGMRMLSSPVRLRRQARRTAYVLTDRRAVVLAAGPWRSTTVRTFDPPRLGDLRRVEYPDGSGDLVFDRTWAGDGDGARQQTDHGFLAVRDVRAVEALVRRLADAAPGRDA